MCKNTSFYPKHITAPIQVRTKRLLSKKLQSKNKICLKRAVTRCQNENINVCFQLCPRTWSSSSRFKPVTARQHSVIH